MIIKVVLLSMLAVVGLYAALQRRKSPFVSAMMLVTIVIGAVLVIFPEFSNDAAGIVGVGRGVDLIFYAFIAISLAAIFNLHLRNRSDHQVLTLLAREIAILSADKPKDKA